MRDMEHVGTGATAEQRNDQGVGAGSSWPLWEHDGQGIIINNSLMAGAASQVDDSAVKNALWRARASGGSWQRRAGSRCTTSRVEARRG